MKYTFAIIFFCLGALNVSAQQTFTEKLQQVVDSVGKIVLHQEKTITDLVNGALKSATKKKQGMPQPVRQEAPRLWGCMANSAPLFAHRPDIHQGQSHPQP